MISKSKVYAFLKNNKCDLQSSKCAQGFSMPWIIMDSMLNNNIYNIYIQSKCLPLSLRLNVWIYKFLCYFSFLIDIIILIQQFKDL